MKDLIIVGAGRVGRLVLQSAKDMNRIEKKWNIKGFINDKHDALKGIECDHEIIGTIKDWQPKDTEIFACALADPKSKELVMTQLKARRAVFESIISPKAQISDFVTIGEGVFVSANSSVAPNVVLGNFTTIMGSMIGQESVIGDFSTTTGYVNIATSQIGKRVYVGSHAVILNDLVVGDDAFIYAGSIVMRNVKAGTKVFGYPAKKVDF